MPKRLQQIENDVQQLQSKLEVMQENKLKIMQKNLIKRISELPPDLRVRFARLLIQKGMQLYHLKMAFVWAVIFRCLCM